MLPQTYCLVNKKSGTALDLSGFDGKSIIGWNHHGGDTQKWTFIPNPDGGWVIQNLTFEKYLDVAGDVKDGVKLVGSDTPRIWDVRSGGPDADAWRIFIRGSNQYIDLSNHGNPTPGTLLSSGARRTARTKSGCFTWLSS